MDVSNEVNNLIKKYKTDNVREIAEFLGISIEYQDFKAKTLDSRIIVVNGIGYIFLRNELNELYENFLIAHELGHYILHYDIDISFNFLRRVYKTRLEKEANRFACTLLLHNELNNIKNIENIEFIVKEKGIPLKIWYSIQNDIYTS